MINSYISRQIFLAFVSYIFIITFVFVLSQSIRFLYVLSSGFSIKDFFYLYLLLIPNTLSISIPVVGFISTFFVYTKLQQNNEITILKNFGFSYLRLISHSAYLGIVLCILSFIIINFIKPWAYQRRDDLESHLKVNLRLLIKEKSFFYFNKRTFYIESVQRQSLQRVFIYQNGTSPSNDNWVIIGETGFVVGKNQESSLILQNGYQYFFPNLGELKKLQQWIKTHQPSVNHFSKYSVNTTQKKKKTQKTTYPLKWQYLTDFFPLPRNFATVKTRMTYEYLSNRLFFPLLSLFFPIIAAFSVLLVPYRRTAPLKHTLYASLTMLVSFLSFSYLLGKVYKPENILYPIIPSVLLFFIYLLRLYKYSKRI